MYFYPFFCNCLEEYKGVLSHLSSKSITGCLLNVQFTTFLNLIFEISDQNALQTPKATS